jgi:thiamine biosynthesis lipoprotein
MPATISHAVASRRQPVDDGRVAAAEIDALGTRVRIVVWPAEALEAATQAVTGELHRLDMQASRFREDSEISRLHARGGGLFLISEGLAEVIGVALAAARFTDGLVDPTVGQALVALGYDRDFAAIAEDEPIDFATARPAPGHRTVALEGRLLHLPAGVLLDVGATAKGLGSDRAGRAALAACRGQGGVLVSLGGDIAVAGEPPVGGWPIIVSDSQTGRDATAQDATAQIVRLGAGALASSSTGIRQWKRSGQMVHHIVDPRTGLSAKGPWHSATVAAATCAEANAASTAAIVGGEDGALWLQSTGLPARLVASDGTVRRFGSWPEVDGGMVKVPARRMIGPVPTSFRSAS